MVHVPSDLGQRIVQAASLAAALHDQTVRNLEQGRPALLSDNLAGSIKDDVPSKAITRRVIPLHSPWTLAGEDPAGSFAA
jgi:hypothetical protein